MITVDVDDQNWKTLSKILSLEEANRSLLYPAKF